MSTDVDTPYKNDNTSGCIRDSLVGITMGYESDDQGWIPSGGKKISSPSQHPDRLCDPPSPVSNSFLETKWTGL
jgi:hypothetical protein